MMPSEPFSSTCALESTLLIKVLVADDNAATLKAIARFLEDEQYRVVGSVRNGMELVNETLALHPDVAVIDIMMPEMTGLEALAELARESSETRFVMLTAHREPEFIQAAFSAGASGYVLKHRMVSDLPAAIEGAMRGERFVSPSLVA